VCERLVLDAKELVEELFRLDEDIRWVGIADQQGNILQNVQRPATESLTDKTTDELTLHVFPTIMGLLWGRLVGTGIGDLKSVVAAYGRLYLMAFYVDELLVVLTFELKGIPNVLNKINERFGVGFASWAPLRDAAQAK
jgi:hypothetical protein